jgi:hypothetical protein
MDRSCPPRRRRKLRRGFYAEQKVRELEAVRQLQLNTLDYMRDASKETFQSAPGRSL